MKIALSMVEVEVEGILVEVLDAFNVIMVEMMMVEMEVEVEVL